MNHAVKIERSEKQVAIRYGGEAAASFNADEDGKVPLQRVENAIRTLFMSIEMQDAGGPDEWLRQVKVELGRPS